MKVLVTGASGRFGPYLVAELEAAGHELVLMCRTRPEAADRWPWVQGDVSVFDDCMRATDGGVEAIHHAGAQPHPTDHPRDWGSKDADAPPFDTTMRSNVMGTYYMLQAAVRRKIGVFVMTGSNCALGHGFRISQSDFPFEYLPVDEEHPSDVEDSYSYSKLAGEQMLASYTRAYGIRTYALRSAGICDPTRRRQMAENVSPAGGWNVWLWVWIGSEDLAAAHRLLMERAADIEPHGVYFCNNDDSSALEPTRELIERFRPDLVPLIRDLDGHDALLSNRKLRQAVGWQPKTGWREIEV